MVQKVIPAHKARPAHKALPEWDPTALPAPLDPRGHADILGLREPQGLKAQLGS